MADKSQYDKSTLHSSRRNRSPACRGVKNIQNAGNDIQNVSEICEGGSSKNDKTKGRVNQTPHGKFLVLLIFSQISMFVSLFLCTWRLFNDSKSGIYIETEFLGIFLNYGQNFVLFALFGFDVQAIIQRLIKRWRKLVYDVENVHIGAADLTEEEKHLCDQFVKYHLDRCTKDIVSNRKHRLKKYEQIFTGRSFCDWLLEAGLCKYRQDAVLYGQTLLKGQIISRVTKEHNFHDMPYFYRFVTGRNVD